MEKLILTVEDHSSLCYDSYIGDQQFKEVESVLESDGEFSTHYSKVLQRVSDGKFFRVFYYEPIITEEWMLYNIDSLEAYQVFPEQQIITVYD